MPREWNVCVDEADEMQGCSTQLYLKDKYALVDFAK